MKKIYKKEKRKKIQTIWNLEMHKWRVSLVETGTSTWWDLEYCHHQYTFDDMISFSWISQPPLVKHMARFRKYNLNSRIMRKRNNIIISKHLLDISQSNNEVEEISRSWFILDFFFFFWRKWFPFYQISTLTMRTTCGYFLHCSWKSCLDQN